MPTTKIFTNARRIDIPEELKPLTGYVIVPIILTPKEFHQFWSKVKEQDDVDIFGHHNIIRTYESRVPLVREAHLFINDEPVQMTPKGVDLADQAIAGFVVAATQDCITRATRIPTLPNPSPNGTK